VMNMANAPRSIGLPRLPAVDSVEFKEHV
jgi:hypothetical protein